MKRIFALLVLALAVVSASAQSYTVVAPESQFLTLTLPAGAVWQIGNVADNKWSPEQTAETAISFTPFYAELMIQLHQTEIFPDPDPSQPKVFRVRQTAAAQTVFVLDRSVTPATSTPVVVPALTATTTPPPPPPAAAPFAIGTVYQFQISAVSNVPGAAFTTFQSLFPIPSPLFLGNVMANFTYIMKTTPDGAAAPVTWACTPALPTAPPNSTIQVSCIVTSVTAP
jgi:hypothetical protein